MLTFTTLAVTIATADAYALSRGLSWSGSDAVKTAALRRGQDWIAGTYNTRWLAEFTDATAPTDVQYAIVEAGVREMAQPGVLTPDVTPGREKILTGVKGIQWTPLRASGGVLSLLPFLSKVEGLLSAHIAAGGTLFLDRA
jgi:hypothetical protein